MNACLFLLLGGKSLESSFACITGGKHFYSQEGNVAQNSEILGAIVITFPHTLRNVPYT